MMLNDDSTVFVSSGTSDSVPSVVSDTVGFVGYGPALEQITARLDVLSDKADFFVGVTQVFVVFVVMTLLYRLFKIFF